MGLVGGKNSGSVRERIASDTVVGGNTDRIISKALESQKSITHRAFHSVPSQSTGAGPASCLLSGLTSVSAHGCRDRRRARGAAWLGTRAPPPRPQIAQSDHPRLGGVIVALFVKMVLV